MINAFFEAFKGTVGFMCKLIPAVFLGCIILAASCGVCVNIIK